MGKVKKKRIKNSKQNQNINDVIINNFLEYLKRETGYTVNYIKPDSHEQIHFK